MSPVDEKDSTDRYWLQCKRSKRPQSNRKVTRQSPNVSALVTEYGCPRDDALTSSLHQPQRVWLLAERKLTLSELFSRLSNSYPHSKFLFKRTSSLLLSRDRFSLALNTFGIENILCQYLLPPSVTLL